MVLNFRPVVNLRDGVVDSILCLDKLMSYFDVRVALDLNVAFLFHIGVNVIAPLLITVGKTGFL